MDAQVTIGGVLLAILGAYAVYYIVQKRRARDKEKSGSFKSSGKGLPPKRRQ